MGCHTDHDKDQNPVLFKEILQKFKKILDKSFKTLYNIKAVDDRLLCLGVAQLVARYLGVVEAVGSSPVTQTIFGYCRSRL